ncbi:isochorismate lyase [Pseudoalteromonas sp. AOP31-A2-14]|uniref:chorismate mutase n=1 Tax=Pseudoalteromonas prydzensis TaxID=182141 RepID=A0ABR9FFZ0_9GAMM|nr:MULTISPECIES: isochorismate lyase [Pseudoalteromonas]MBE0455954.1 isochorismate lyase [Pseudoalteromonas prydzensis]WKD26309.1 isochorismate lyase [Pseudoalteromonas sp. KG3]
MKSPSECESLKDIRDGIDSIDHEIIKLLGERMEYVLSAARFKPNQASIPAPDRVAEMLLERRQWALQHKLPADYIESLYHEIIQWYIAQQTQYWRTKHSITTGNKGTHKLGNG